METRKKEFVAQLRKLLHEAYVIEKAEKTVPSEKRGEIQGFLKAGKLLGILDFDTMQGIIDEENIKVFGCSLAERKKPVEKAVEKPEKSIPATDNDRYSLIPAIFRRRAKEKKD